MFSPKSWVQDASDIFWNVQCLLTSESLDSERTRLSWVDAEGERASECVLWSWTWGHGWSRVLEILARLWFAGVFFFFLINKWAWAYRILIPIHIGSIFLNPHYSLGLICFPRTHETGGTTCWTSSSLHWIWCITQPVKCVFLPWLTGQTSICITAKRKPPYGP